MEHDQISDNSFSEDYQPNMKQICMSANTEKRLSEQLNRTLSLNQFELSMQEVNSQMIISNQNQRLSTPIPFNQINPESADNSDMDQLNESNSSFSSNGSTRRRCITYRRHIERRTLYQNINELNELNTNMFKIARLFRQMRYMIINAMKNQ